MITNEFDLIEYEYYSKVKLRWYQILLYEIIYPTPSYIKWKRYQSVKKYIDNEIKKDMIKHPKKYTNKTKG